jgi:hypothetical protein
MIGLTRCATGIAWAVIGLDPIRGRLAAGRLTDKARVIFDGKYLREHLILGYAGTVHSAQGVTIGTAATPGCLLDCHV